MIPGLFVAEHEFEVPLDHGAPGETITVFAREVADPDGRERPWLVYLQGGPGFESPRPTGTPRGPGWLDRALKDFRVLLLDQRGTGRSTPAGGDESAEYLIHFRADSIVRDCEVIREALGSGPWSVLGQSYGGITLLTYLSFAPEGLREAFITGGVPGIGVHVDDIFSATWERVRERSRRYYERYPEDRERMLALPDRFRSLGNWLGMSDGFERVHHVLELPPDSPAFKADARDPLGLERNPIYGLLHEACWADGFATNWSAQRVRPEMPPEYFTAEHILPSMFEGARRATADALAAHEWPRLFDEAVLRANEVPVAATIYTEDLYVERRFAEQTAEMVPRMRAWITSEYDHNGLRVDGERILDRLIDLARGRA
ncbi:alpha/beta fold hydrolase [Solirubrobacter sp. CPCC 204708]|uniref:Alpha/beta hydrolase n=1 Tax=Solirubrobacter deserti TaxID=2282478 RepID=A0ABT4RV66_9ACTN|nr:alpha/beta fold hydrolase [Solirubrobacter deserti]MBE2320669.1 alpha/beta fold hydrolase [Solirubrobacter deserti]MDA0142426.1 alpha/beta hydrolase [Solirubrobacter deserti]